MNLKTKIRKSKTKKNKFSFLDSIFGITWCFAWLWCPDFYYNFSHYYSHRFTYICYYKCILTTATHQSPTTHWKAIQVKWFIKRDRIHSFISRGILCKVSFCCIECSFCLVVCVLKFIWYNKCNKFSKYTQPHTALLFHINKRVRNIYIKNFGIIFTHTH